MRARTALVAEDNDQLGCIIRYLLEREQYQVQLAGDGRQAEKLIDLSPPPSLAVLDIMMPYASGFQLLARIRGRADWTGVPVIMLTGKAQERDIVRAFSSGASDYVTKPFQPNEFLARVNRLTK